MFGDIPGGVRAGGQETNMRTDPYAVSVAALVADGFTLLSTAVEVMGLPGRRAVSPRRPVGDRVAGVALLVDVQ